MGKRNLTVALDGEAITEAKVLAARRGTSVSQLIARQIRELAAQERRYEEAYALWHESLDTVTLRTERQWTRDELYDRPAFRDR